MTRASTALSLVSSSDPFVREVVLFEGERQDYHSLHDMIAWAESYRPELVSFFVERYSNKGDVVLDPFAGSGTTTLTAALMGRVVVGIDIDPLATFVAQTSIQPADITEVTLELQNLVARRPVDLTVFRDTFSAFYDVNTFRELMNVRTTLMQRSDRVAEFLKLIVASILHGPSASFLSTYSFAHTALSAAEQERVNAKRHQFPDYRPVVPRILKRAATVTRDGIPSVLQTTSKLSRFMTGDARNLSDISSGSVDLIVTGPPKPGSVASRSGQWLRNWFLDLPAAAPQRSWNTLADWVDFINSSLLEMARVLKRGGRAVLDLGEYRAHGQILELDGLIGNMVATDLAGFFDVEGVYVHRGQVSQVRQEAMASQRQLVLRRRG